MQELVVTLIQWGDLVSAASSEEGNGFITGFHASSVNRFSGQNKVRRLKQKLILCDKLVDLQNAIVPAHDEGHHLFPQFVDVVDNPNPEPLMPAGQIQGCDVIRNLIGMTEAAFAKMEIAEDTYASLKHAITAAKKGGYVFCYNAPVLIAVANRRDYGNNMADCACAIENMMVAANALDLGSCWINQLRWLNEEPALVEYLQSLGMKEDERIYGAVIIGYPATESGLPNRNWMQQKGNEVTMID